MDGLARGGAHQTERGLRGGMAASDGHAAEVQRGAASCALSIA